jgi:hypothetical protein
MQKIPNKYSKKEMQTLQIRHNKEKQLFEERMDMLDDFTTRYKLVSRPDWIEYFDKKIKIIDRIVELNPRKMIKSMNNLRKFMDEYSLEVNFVDGEEIIEFEPDFHLTHDMIEEEEEEHSDDELVYFTNENGKLETKYM